MYLSIVFGMLVLCSLCMSVCRFTVSNDFERSRAIATVLLGGFLLLKPLVIVLFISCNAVVVECLCLKPCWCGGMIVLLVMCGRMIFLLFLLWVRVVLWPCMTCLELCTYQVWGLGLCWLFSMCIELCMC